MSKIVVTGGLGYIGVHTAVRLMEKGYEVIVIDNLLNSSMDMLERIEDVLGAKPSFSHLDLCNYDELELFFKEAEGIEAVVHFAALKAVKESVEFPLKYYRNNLFGLINLIELMKTYQINNLVFSSSATVYGEPDQLPLRESHPTKTAMSPYGNTKKIGEEIIRDTVKASKNFKAISLRYFNPIGAHHTAKIGELPNGIPNNLMPFITQTAAGERKELIIFGDDYETPDGTAIRDYIHVEDLAEAHVTTLERMLLKQQKEDFEIFNLGTGRGSSVLDIIQSFERTSGLNLKYRIAERRPGDVPQMYAATDLAATELGWKAQRNLDEMTASAWAWECQVRGVNQKEEKK